MYLHWSSNWTVSVSGQIRYFVESPKILRSNSKERLHASLALLPVDQEQVEFLYSRLLVAGPTELPVLRDALRPLSGTADRSDCGMSWSSPMIRANIFRLGAPWHCMTQQILGGRRSAAR